MPEEKVVAEDETNGIPTDEFLADQERLGDAGWRVLDQIRERQPQLSAVAEEFRQQWQVTRRTDDQDIANAGEHQHGERIVNHRLVVDRQQLLADGPSQGVKTRPAAACEQNAFHG